MRKSTLTLLTIITCALTSLPTLAAWQLDNNHSQLNFVSVKKGTVAENHRFTSITGNIDDQGKANINVDLTSVDTNIAIRNERMKKFVFQTDKYTSASFNAQLDNIAITALNHGDSYTTSVKGTLNFHGQSQEVIVDVNVVKLSGNKLFVSTVKPFFIKADAYGVVKGINKLKELASLPSINYVVPVNFSVTFTQ